ncbi:hypothetical protein ACFVWX_13765 [Streptomyces sp. NPDC058220]|uniref:hypothetical protein n=1 Tax=Streptomyces sp. NPDC058220 TaxID=3346387 RepID=UPI0036F12067
MVRNIIGSILALAGAAAAVLSPFHAWFDGRQGRDYRIADLFNGLSATSSGVFVSLLLPFVFAALVTLTGVLLRSRPLVSLAGLTVLGFTILWTVRQGQAAGGLSVGRGGGLGLGVAYAFGGGFVLLLAALVMSGRRRRERLPRYEAPTPGPVMGGPPADEDWGPHYGSDPYAPAPYGSQQYGLQQYGSQQYGSQPQGSQQYGSEPHGAHPYVAPADATPPYGFPQYGSQQDWSHQEDDTQSWGINQPWDDDAASSDSTDTDGSGTGAGSGPGRGTGSNGTPRR